MIIDNDLKFSALQVLTSDAASTNSIDQSKPGDALGGQELYLVVRIGTAVDSAADGATLTISLQSDSDSGFATALKTHFSITLSQAACKANTIVAKIKLPPGLQRYLRLYYAHGVEAITAGTVDAFLTPDVEVR